MISKLVVLLGKKQSLGSFPWDQRVSAFLSEDLHVPFGAYIATQRPLPSLALISKVWLRDPMPKVFVARISYESMRSILSTKWKLIYRYFGIGMMGRLVGLRNI